MSFLQSERIIEVQDQQEMVGILGRNDELLRVIKEHYESVIVARGNVIVFSGEDNEVGQIETLFKELLFLYRQGMPLTTHDVRYSIGMIAEGRLESLHRMYADTIIVTNRGTKNLTRNLHENGIMGIMTGYEEKFYALGTPINRCELINHGVLPDPEPAEKDEQTGIL